MQPAHGGPDKEPQVFEAFPTGRREFVVIAMDDGILSFVYPVQGRNGAAHNYFPPRIAPSSLSIQ